MGKKSGGLVAKAFGEYVEQIFEPMAREFAWIGPTDESRLLPAYSYHDQGIRYMVMLDWQPPVRVETTVDLAHDGWTLVADLDKLLAVAGITDAGRLRSSASNLRNLELTLEDQAKYLRRIRPLLLEQRGDLLQQATPRVHPLRPEHLL